MNGQLPSITSIIALIAGLGLLPVLVVTVTSFAKIAIVLAIVRNALGIQQVPPNMLLYSLAIILSAFIMAPVLSEVHDRVTNPRNRLESYSDYERVAREAGEPLRQFMYRHSTPKARTTFANAGAVVWAGSNRPRPQESDAVVVLPAFLVSELSNAFQIGFMLYLPFLVIDFVVASVLIALGMSMLSPTVISTPLKLLLFVAVSGWERLLEGLVLSYARV
jgi:type III secretion protein R